MAFINEHAQRSVNIRVAAKTPSLFSAVAPRRLTADQQQGRPELRRLHLEMTLLAMPAGEI
jgi:hypothetical protein